MTHRSTVQRLAAIAVILLVTTSVEATRGRNSPLVSPTSPEQLESQLQTRVMESALADALARWEHSPWRAPVPREKARLSSAFGTRRHPILGGLRHHDGIDLSAPIGTPVNAAADGVVISAIRSPTYGRVVDIDHGRGWISRYAHLSKIAVAPGETVRGGQRIGAVGSTGLSSGPHLHFEIYFNARSVDPWTLWETVAQLRGRIDGLSSDSAPSLSSPS